MRNYSATTGTNADSFRRMEVITGVGRRRRWTDEDKARIVAESLNPATTSSAVARRFSWPSPAEGVVRLSAAQLATLLEGLPWHRLQPRTIPRPSTAW